jgi:hypothetical protein
LSDFVAYVNYTIKNNGQRRILSLHHVPGELVVVHEVTLAAAVTNLKRLLVACGDRMVYIITPGPRYHGIPCCCSGDHCTHLQMPESGIKLMQDLARLHL